MLVLTVLVTGCSPAAEPQRPLPDVSEVEAPLVVERFEQALFQLDTNAFTQALPDLVARYPDFAELYSTSLLQAGSLQNPTPEQLAYLRGYVTSPVYRAIYDTTQLVYPDLEPIRTELQQALRYFKHHFPRQAAPEKLTTFTAAFNYASIIYGENELGVGLDMFLGPDFNYQRYNPGAPIFSNYLSRTYNKDHVVAALMRVVLDDLLGPCPENTLLGELIHRGKLLYFLDACLPSTPDTVKFRVTPTQMDWLKDNERNLWSHLLSEELLYSTRYQDWRKLIEPSPSGAPVLPADSPGEAGNYLGYRIVRQLMNKRTDLALSDLLQYQDAQEVLELARYKPPRN
ncbi:MAG: hypothetical protein AAGJ82_04970 [Bacteroidota bacterium]